VRSDAGTGACLEFQDTYSCPTPGQTVTTASNCPTDKFCIGGGCFDIAYANDPDFAMSSSDLEGGREAGVYMDPAKLTIFNGEDDRCRNKAFKDCCSTDPTGKSMTNQEAFGMGSRLVYDTLMNSGNREFVTAGLQALLTDAGFNGTYSTYGFTLALNGTALPGGTAVLYSSSPGVAGEGVVIGFDPWSLAVTVFIYVAMQLMSCSSSEGRLSLMQGASLCHDIGEYCSKKILGICLEHTHTSCCFNSLLARLINEQGRLQIGRRWGNARSPQCVGFSVAELQRLNFSAMDFSAFYASLVPTLPDVMGVQGGNANQLPSCYYGEGRC
jgi:conjugal transfer mating pair stabilization protein TraN